MRDNLNQRLAKSKKTGNKPLPVVVVAIPFYRTILQTSLMLHQTLQDTGIPGYTVMIRDLPSNIIVMARNDALQDAPGMPWDFLFFVDDDNGFPLSGMLESVIVRDHTGREVRVSKIVGLMKKILDHDLNICGGYYCNRATPHTPHVFRKFCRDGEETYLSIVDPPLTGVEEVDALATGFLCIKRNVIDTFKAREAERIELRRRYLNWRAMATEEGTLATQLAALPGPVKDFLSIAKADITPPFWNDYLFDPAKKRWVHWGEDLYFCREAQKLGYRIFVDWEVEIGHMYESFITPEGYRHAFKDQCVAAQKKFLGESEGRDKEAEDTAARLKAAGLVSPEDPANVEPVLIEEAEVASG
jgi:hypothetical protein